MLFFDSPDFNVVCQVSQAFLTFPLSRCMTSAVGIRSTFAMRRELREVTLAFMFLAACTVVAGSSQAFGQEPAAKKPNVVVIWGDDIGTENISYYNRGMMGYKTPNIDRVGKEGVFFTDYYGQQSCTAGRAAFINGSCPVRTGMTKVGIPGAPEGWQKTDVTMATVMKSLGYSTGQFGKNHQGDRDEHLPTMHGFDGFNQGETNQYYPTIYRNTSWVPQPKTPEEGYHFTADMTDEAIAWTRNIRAAAPDKPWFNYFSTAGTHAPHHAPTEWRAKYVGKFDHGWDKQRELTHAKQLEMGIIPPGTKLTPRSRDVPAWADQIQDAKKVYARLMENYAAYMAYTDHEVGRLIDSLDATGELDNTLVMYIVGDNGASAEGGLEGTFSEIASLLGIQLGLESTLKRIDEIGGPTSEPHVPVGWAWAMNAPFQWTRQVASHFGGTRNPMIVHWPRGIAAKGENRNQFHHVIDVVPTILEACKIPEPKLVNGIVQKPIEGTSMVYSFDDANARDRRTTQYFELMTNRAIYHDGWIACSAYGQPWQTAGRGDGFLTAPWELYNINEDFSQANDLATRMPDKLQELKAKFLEEAKKYDVFPLDSRFAERLDPSLRVSGEPKTAWTFFGNNVALPEPIGPQLFPRGHTMSAELEIPKGGAEGVVTCAGAFSAGWSLYVKGGKPVFRYTFFEVADVTIHGTETRTEGKATLKTEFAPDGSKEGGGTLKLFVNGKPAGEGQLKRSAFRHGLEPFEVGRDSITPVSPDYKTPFAFTGKIDRIKFEITK